MRDLKVVFHLFEQSSRLAKKRAFLTIAAIAWGTVAILLLLAFGEGLKRQLDSNRKAMGENIAVVWSGESSKPYKGLPVGRDIKFRIEDIELLRARIPEANFAGEIIQWRTSLAYGTKAVNSRVKGVHVEWGDMRKHFPVEGGRWLSALDEKEKRRVVFMGDETAKDVFGTTDPVGKLLLINNAPFTVVGVMQRKVQMGAYSGPDKNAVVIPISTFKAMFGRDQLSNIVVQSPKPGQMKGILRQMNEVLGGKLGFDPEDDRALPTWDTVKSAKTNMNFSMGIQIFLGIIGALTLLIGGVGVANIMYAVVKERTKEIGVKMALGAKARWITLPFVLEGLVYTFLGGAAGTLIAVLLVTGMGFIPSQGNRVMEFLGKPTLSPLIGLATAGILGVIGLLAGWFPARRAASIDPASTLRYE
ncbi:MAG: ABC transporter permease [Acidobacteria bacterium]|nr:ABC transporter permease [Acidobacteriota bacterium]